MNAATTTEVSHRLGPLRFQLFLLSAILGFLVPVVTAAVLADDGDDGSGLVMMLVAFASLAMLAGNAGWRLNLQGGSSTTIAGVGLAVPSLFLVLIYYASLGPSSPASDTTTLVIAGVQLAIGLLLIALQAQLPRLPLTVTRHRVLPQQSAPRPTTEPETATRSEGLSLQKTATGIVQAMLDFAAAAELLLGSFFLVGFVVFLPSLWADLSAHSSTWSICLALSALGGSEFVLLRAFRRSHPVAGTLAPPVLLLMTAGPTVFLLSPNPAAAPVATVTASLLALLACRWYLRTRRNPSRATAVHATRLGSPTAAQGPVPEATAKSGDIVRPASKPWSPSELWLAFAIIPVVLYALSFAFIALAGFMSVGVQTEPSLELFELASIEAEFLALWIVLLYLVRRKGHPWSIVGLKPFPLRTLLVIPASYPMQLAALTSFNTALLPVLPAVQAYQTSLDPAFEPSGVAIGFTFLGMVVMAPIVEELLFRGFFFTGFRSYIGPVGAAVVSAVLFSLAHAFPLFSPFSLNLSPTQALSTFLAGLVWAGMRHDSDSVFPSMLAHAAWNLMVGF
jgi:membrane protease YdiL (CAAX protease family)